MGKCTLGSVNGIEVNKTVRCQYCGSEMRQGGCQLGAGTNSISYWCDECGSVAVFLRNSEKKITGIETKCKFDD